MPIDPAAYTRSRVRGRGLSFGRAHVKGGWMISRTVRGMQLGPAANATGLGRQVDP